MATTYPTPYPHPIPLKRVYQFWRVGSCAQSNQPSQISTRFGSGVWEPQVVKNRYLSLTRGIALTTMYALTCYTVIISKYTDKTVLSQKRCWWILHNYTEILMLVLMLRYNKELSHLVVVEV